MNKNIGKSKANHVQGNIPYKNCLNCGSELQGKYCHVCGQEATSKTPTVGAFLLEYINNAFIWDPKFFKTIWTLISRPGRLTNEYIAGKFVSQEHPLKLNMFLLFVFITLFVFFAGTEKMSNSVYSLTNSESVRPSLQLESLLKTGYAEKFEDSPRDTVQLLAPLFLTERYSEVFSNIETIEDTDGEGLDKWIAVFPHVLIEDNIIIWDESGYYRFNLESEAGQIELQMVNSVWSEMVNLMARYFPFLVLFTAPFLSLSLGLVQRKSRIPRIHHFIFALHYTAFLEVQMMFIYLLHLTLSPPMALLQGIMIVGSCLYLTIAFRKVYRTSTWLKATLKALFTSVVYLLIGLVIFMVIFFIACFAIVNKGLVG